MKKKQLSKLDKLAKKELTKFTFICGIVLTIIMRYALLIRLPKHTDIELIAYLLSNKGFAIYTLVTWLVCIICLYFLGKPIILKRAKEKLGKENFFN